MTCTVVASIPHTFKKLVLRKSAIQKVGMEDDLT